MHYRKEIDGLRGLAVLAVIFNHAGLSLFSGGFVGVDIFFVISGYLIASIISTNLQEDNFSLLYFYEKRARRILPALIFMIIVMAPFIIYWMPPSDVLSFSQSLLFIPVFLTNIFFYKHSGYFDAIAEFKPLLHTWSLAVEEQFYVLFPLLLVYLWGKCKEYILFFLTIIFGFSLLIACYETAVKPNAAFFLTPYRIWEFMLGAFIAYIEFKGFKKDLRLRYQILSLVGIFLILFSIFNFDKYTVTPGILTLLPTLGTSLILLYSDSKNLSGQFLSNRVLVGIGLFSYSAYLWHQPIFVLSRQIFENPTRFLMLLLSGVAMLIGYFSWRYVEIPFRDRKLIKNRLFLVTLTICMGVIFSIGILGSCTAGFKDSKLTKQQSKIIETANKSPKRESCHASNENNIKPENACEYFLPNSDVAVFGDSHAVELAFSLSKQLQLKNRGIKHFTYSGCYPVFGIDLDKSGCSKWTKEVVNYIVNDEHIKYVVVSYRINSELYGDHEKSYPSIPNSIDKESRNVRWNSYVSLLKYFNSHQKKVVLVLQSPELPRNVEELIAKKGIRENSKIWGVSRSWWNDRSAFVRDRLNQLPDDVVVVDPSNIFCNLKKCLAVTNGISYYYDDNHLSLNGASLVANEILQHIE